MLGDFFGSAWCRNDSLAAVENEEAVAIFKGSDVVVLLMSR